MNTIGLNQPIHTKLPGILKNVGSNNGNLVGGLLKSNDAKDKDPLMDTIVRISSFIRGNIQVENGGTFLEKFEYPKNLDNINIQAINAMGTYCKYSLDELRAIDYSIIKKEMGKTQSQQGIRIGIAPTRDNLVTREKPSTGKLFGNLGKLDNLEPKTIAPLVNNLSISDNVKLSHQTGYISLLNTGSMPSNNVTGSTGSLALLEQQIQGVSLRDLKPIPEKPGTILSTMPNLNQPNENLRNSSTQETRSGDQNNLLRVTNHQENNVCLGQQQENLVQYQQSVESFPSMQIFNQVNGGLYDYLFQRPNFNAGHIQEVLAPVEIQAQSSSLIYEPLKIHEMKKIQMLSQGTNDNFLSSTMNSSMKYPYNPFAKTPALFPTNRSQLPNFNFMGPKSLAKTHFRRQSEPQRLAGFRTSKFFNENQSNDDLNSEENLARIINLKSDKWDCYEKLTGFFDKIRIRIIYKQKEKPNRIFNIEIDINDTFFSLKNTFLQKIQDENKNPMIYKIIHQNMLISDHTRIKDSNVKDSDIIYIMQDDTFDKINCIPDEINQRNHSFAPEYMIPKLTKPGYFTEPSIIRLSRMSEDDLAYIEGFSIYNKYVKVIWEGQTDVRGINLDVIVNFEHQSAEIYPDNQQKPLIGEQLNKPARMIFYNWEIPKKYQKDKPNYKNKLKQWATAINADFEYFDENKGEVSIKVKHF